MADTGQDQGHPSNDPYEDDIAFGNNAPPMDAPGTPGIKKDFSQSIEEAQSSREAALSAHAKEIDDKNSEASAPNV